MWRTSSWHFAYRKVEVEKAIKKQCNVRFLLVRRNRVFHKIACGLVWMLLRMGFVPARVLGRTSIWYFVHRKVEVEVANDLEIGDHGHALLSGTRVDGQMEKADL